jgi:hypothetical protein
MNRTPEVLSWYKGILSSNNTVDKFGSIPITYKECMLAAGKLKVF